MRLLQIASFLAVSCLAHTSPYKTLVFLLYALADTNVSSFEPWSRGNLTLATPAGSSACNSLFSTNQARSSYQTAVSSGLRHINVFATASAITTNTQSSPTPQTISPPIQNGGHRLPIGWGSTLFIKSYEIIYYYARLLLILFLLILIFFWCILLKQVEIKQVDSLNQSFVLRFKSCKV